MLFDACVLLCEKIDGGRGHCWVQQNPGFGSHTPRPKKKKKIMQSVANDFSPQNSKCLSQRYTCFLKFSTLRSWTISADASITLISRFEEQWNIDPNFCGCGKRWGHGRLAAPRAQGCERPVLKVGPQSRSTFACIILKTKQLQRSGSKAVINWNFIEGTEINSWEFLKTQLISLKNNNMEGGGRIE